jgi:hypothetical protein
MAVSSWASSNPPPDTKLESERVAAKLKFFDTGVFLFDRDDLRFTNLPKEMEEEYFRLIRLLSDDTHAVEIWTKLLRHADPRVRTLALAALFAREDPKLLPQIASLLEDKSLTFSSPEHFAGLGPLDGKFQLQKQTVGDVAGRMVGFYLSSVGIDLHLRSPEPHEFKRYWEARKDRVHCASWFGVKLARATQGTSPPPKQRRERVKAIRKEIDKIPERDRAWVMLWLMASDGSHELISREELVVLVNELGPDRLLGLLRREADSNDPDWVHPQKKGTWRNTVAVEFVLANSHRLLRPKDAKTLLAYEARERDSVKMGNATPILTAQWAIGAAQLDPEAAAKLLREAFGRHQARYQKQDRAQLALALWRTAGLKEQAFLIDWFYKEEPGLGEIGFGRVAFMRSIAGVRSPDNRKLLAAIVRDKQFDSLEWQTLESLIQVVNSWVEQPIVDPQDLRKASHPLGMGHFVPASYGKAKMKYPKQTEDLLKVLESWRSATRASVSMWEKGTQKKS